MKQPFEWEREFISGLRCHPSGKKAWERLEAAGLGEFAKFLLYRAYAYGASVSAEVSERLGEQNAPIQALKRAERVARERQGDPRAQMFEKRHQAALENVENALWPFQNERVQTWGDAKREYSVLGALPLDQMAAVSGVGRQDVARYEVKTALVILLAAERASQVDLSLTELSELAYAAGLEAAGLDKENPNPPLDTHALQRFFAQDDIRRAEKAWQRHFEASEGWDLCRISEAVKREIAQKL